MECDLTMTHTGLYWEYQTTWRKETAGVLTIQYMTEEMAYKNV